MGFFGKLKKGFKKLGKGIKNTAKKIGKGISKGIKWGKKQFNKVVDTVEKVPVLGDAVKTAETLAKDIPGVSQALSAVNTVEDLADGNLQKALRDGAGAVGGRAGQLAVATADAIDAGIKGDKNALIDAGANAIGGNVARANDLRNQFSGN